MVATPRVSATTLQQYQPGTPVRVVGQVVNINNDLVVLQAADGTINVRKQPNSPIIGGHFFEVVGAINQDRSITEQISYDWGEKFDLDLYNGMLQVYQKYSHELFL